MFKLKYTTLLIFVFLFILIPLKAKSKKIRKLRIIIFLFVLIIFLINPCITIKEIDKRIEEIRLKILKNNSITSLNFREKIGIYGLNILMGLFAYPIYPEAAKETLFLMIKPNNNLKREFKLKMPIKSYKINNIIRDYIAILKKEGKKGGVLKRKLVWSSHQYLNKIESRYALAFNSGEIVLYVKKVKDKWNIYGKIIIKISYPKRSYITLLKCSRKVKLRVEEGLFWLLQKSGWLYPYIAEWNFSLIVY
jgi:hypothetical protein